LTWIGPQCVSLLVGRRLATTRMPRSHSGAWRRAVLVIRTKVRAASPDDRAVIRRRKISSRISSSSAQKSRITPDAREPCMTVVDQLAALPTPALLLDERPMGLGVRLRPHLKTAKSVDVARRLLDGALGQRVFRRTFRRRLTS